VILSVAGAEAHGGGGEAPNPRGVLNSRAARACLRGALNTA